MQLSRFLVVLICATKFSLYSLAQDDIVISERTVKYSYRQNYASLEGVDTTGIDKYLMIVKDSVTGFVMEIDFWDLLLKTETRIILTERLDIGTIIFKNRREDIHYNYMDFVESEFQKFYVQGPSYFRVYRFEDGRISHFSKRKFQVGNTVGKVWIKRKINRELQMEIDMVKGKAMELLYTYINATDGINRFSPRE